MTGGFDVTERVRPIAAAIRTLPIPHKDKIAAPGEIRPFITISREAGGGAKPLAQELVNALNQTVDSAHRWSSWDRELVEKVARDCQLSESLIEHLEESNHSWLTSFLTSLSMGEDADEARVYGRVAATIRALAQAGRVVIVGMGSVFITHRMPGGIHIRVTAPLEQRIGFMMESHQISHDAAVARIRELEKNRARFYKRYWPNESLGPETFAMTLNMAIMDIPTMVEVIRTAVPRLVATHA